ncbi:hypothetical protein, partial [Streptomyces liangshanensis]|uniref:hypothetical protein n=1 Tax=Streptomyces liangshanensis TaxID=2717324 RepID=UPI0036DA972B
YLALTFGTLLSSQGTDASFGPVSGALRALPFGISCFKLYQAFFVFLTTDPQTCRSEPEVRIKV